MKYPLVISKMAPKPTIHIKDNVIINSVPEETSLFTRCDNQETFTPEQASLKIKGMGQVTLPDGSHFKTLVTHQPDDIYPTDIYEILSIEPVISNGSIKLLPDFDTEVTAISLSFDDMSIPPLDDIRLESFHPTRFISFLVCFSCTVVAIIILGCMIDTFRNSIIAVADVSSPDQLNTLTKIIKTQT